MNYLHQAKTISLTIGFPMKVILTCETGFPLLRVFGKTELVSLSQLPRLLRLGVATEVEFLRELLAILATMALAALADATDLPLPAGQHC